MEIVVLLAVAAGLVGFTVYAVRRKLASDAAAFEQSYQPTPQNSVENDADDAGIAFEGWNRFSSDPFRLAAGSYRMLYAFPEDVRVQVELFAAGRKTAVWSAAHSGSGEAAFSIPGGDYVAIIKPSQRDHHWEIEFTTSDLT